MAVAVLLLCGSVAFAPSLFALRRQRLVVSAWRRHYEILRDGTWSEAEAQLREVERVLRAPLFRWTP